MDGCCSKQCLLKELNMPNTKKIRDLFKLTFHIVDFVNNVIHTKTVHDTCHNSGTVLTIAAVLFLDGCNFIEVGRVGV